MFGSFVGDNEGAELIPAREDPTEDVEEMQFDWL